ncbi:nitroreductase family protein [Saccharicrinis fermentans]|uniref:FMN reductase n=2 Tax=Saccharicrinis fermentans TaxID=982 RepID=W7YTW7_9BACT|nr:nitroreductase family protein [Saccharicrinis fermentans]GAF05889.1 FMN reductase [Saccharicrinis fermentans DSM 9555 = JCM 21142]
MKDLGSNTLEIIHKRKSVRNYTDKEVSKTQLETLVKAGMAAPTAVNKQPWAFIVVNDRAALDELGDHLPYAKMAKKASAAIVVCGDLTKALEGWEQEFWIQDCSAASQNILLAAEALGLGAVWTAAYPAKDRMATVRRVLGLPKHIIPLNVIPIGYPKGIEKPKDKWRPENLHWGKW